jgi:hypothetical protein
MFFDAGTLRFHLGKSQRLASNLFPSPIEGEGPYAACVRTRLKILQILTSLVRGSLDAPVKKGAGGRGLTHTIALTRLV